MHKRSLLITVIVITYYEAATKTSRFFKNHYYVDTYDDFIFQMTTITMTAPTHIFTFTNRNWRDPLCCSVWASWRVWLSQLWLTRPTITTAASPLARNRSPANSIITTWILIYCHSKTYNSLLSIYCTLSHSTYVPYRMLMYSTLFLVDLSPTTWSCFFRFG